MQISETIGNEAVFLGISVLAGAALFLVYDMLRIFRRLVSHGSLWIGAEDFCYWLFCAAVVFLMLYQENDGRIRGFAFGGIMVGAILYYGIFSRFVIQLNVWIFRHVLGLLRPVFCFFFHPLLKYGKKILFFSRKQLKKIGKVVKMGLCKL